MMMYKYAGKILNTEQLFTKAQILQMLSVYGENWHGISKIREIESERFDAELTRRYPISDSEFLGFFITPVQEGILKIPYDEVNKAVGEFLIIEKAKLMTFDDAAFAAEDWSLFSDDLTSVLSDIKIITENEERKNDYK